jgi:hypothetical protein
MSGIKIAGRAGVVCRWEYAPGKHFVYVTGIWAVLFICPEFSYPAANDPE